MEIDQNLPQKVPKFVITCWRNREEFLEVYELIFGAGSTKEDRQKALQKLFVWKIRRCQETPTSVLSTIAVLEVQVKDECQIITEKSTLSTLYATAITKFLNFMTTLQLHESTMYKSARNLGIDSFIVDLRHLVSHGQELPSLEVFQNSANYCMNWLKTFYWDREKDNISSATMKEIVKDNVLEFEDKVTKAVILFDLFLELNHKNYQTAEAVKSSKIDDDRKQQVLKYLADKRTLKFNVILKSLIHNLWTILESREMRFHSHTFFDLFTENCCYFMSVDENSNLVEISDLLDDSDAEVEDNQKSSIIGLTQQLIFAIVKFDFLGIFLDHLFKIYNDSTISKARRDSSRFWILTLLKSFNYYKKYCELFDNLQQVFKFNKVDENAREIYVKKLKADLKEIFVLAGTQNLPTTVKFSIQFLEDFMKGLNEDNKEICLSLIPLVYPPLDSNQITKIKDLINILTIRGGKLKTSDTGEIRTVTDLKKALGLLEDVEMQESTDGENIWTLTNDKIDWSKCPIGMEIF